MVVENPFILIKHKNKHLALPKKTNKLGLRGVSYHKQSGKFRVKIGIKGKVYELGYFDSPDEARRKYLDAASWLSDHDGEPFPDNEKGNDE